MTALAEAVECGAHVGSDHYGHDCIELAGHNGQPHRCFCADVWRDGDTGSTAADDPAVDEWLESAASFTATPATLLATLVRFRVGSAEKVTVRDVLNTEGAHVVAQQGGRHVAVGVSPGDSLLRELLNLDRRPTGLDAVLELPNGHGRAHIVRTETPDLEFRVRFPAVHPEQDARDPEG